MDLKLPYLKNKYLLLGPESAFLSLLWKYTGDTPDFYQCNIKSIKKEESSFLIKSSDFL